MRSMFERKTFFSGPVECLSCIKQLVSERIIEDATNGLVIITPQIFCYSVLSSPLPFRGFRGWVSRYSNSEYHLTPGMWLDGCIWVWHNVSRDDQILGRFLLRGDYSPLKCSSQHSFLWCDRLIRDLSTYMFPICCKSWYITVKSGAAFDLVALFFFLFTFMFEDLLT